MASMWRIKKVVGETGLSQSQVYQGVKEGWFPPPAKTMPGEKVKSQAWFDDEVIAYNEERRTARDAKLKAAGKEPPPRAAAEATP
jgi:predicted DNA-binding transcriptional regulator AlpA